MHAPRQLSVGLLRHCTPLSWPGLVANARLNLKYIGVPQKSIFMLPPTIMLLIWASEYPFQHEPDWLPYVPVVSTLLQPIVAT